MEARAAGKFWFWADCDNSIIAVGGNCPEGLLEIELSKLSAKIILSGKTTLTRLAGSST